MLERRTECVDSLNFERRRQRSLEEQALRHGRRAETAKDVDLGLIDEATSRNRRIGGSKDRQAAMSRRETKHVAQHRRIRSPRRPELPSAQPDP
jgi:hypothetical protein